MNSHFNRQFILLDFRLLANQRFQKFIGTSEFPTYLILRKNTWRSAEPHYMGLHTLYEQERKLACSLTRDKIAAERTGIAEDNISRHLSGLQEKGIIKSIRTGRQNIYVLGEWIDVHGDGSYKGLEWFYLDGIFGLSKSDLTLSVRSDPIKSSDQTRLLPSDQTRRSAPHNNKEGNRESNKTVNGDDSLFKKLPTLNQPTAKTEYVANHILKQLGDQQSARFYTLIAAKIPEHIIRQALSEINVDGAREPAKLFTYKMKQHALQRLKAMMP